MHNNTPKIHSIHKITRNFWEIKLKLDLVVVKLVKFTQTVKPVTESKNSKPLKANSNSTLPKNKCGAHTPIKRSR